MAGRQKRIRREQKAGITETKQGFTEKLMRRASRETDETVNFTRRQFELVGRWRLGSNGTGVVVPQAARIEKGGTARGEIFLCGEVFPLRVLGNTKVGTVSDAPFLRTGANSRGGRTG